MFIGVLIAMFLVHCRVHGHVLHCVSDFEWVAEDMCEVQLRLFNPLAVELHMLYLVSHCDVLLIL